MQRSRARRGIGRQLLEELRGHRRLDLRRRGSERHQVGARKEKAFESFSSRAVHDDRSRMKSCAKAGDRPTPAACKRCAICAAVKPSGIVTQAATCAPPVTSARSTSSLREVRRETVFAGAHVGLFARADARAAGTSARCRNNAFGGELPRDLGEASRRGR